ncbi:MAG: quinolinate synthase NadA [Bdellovibrionales bacterium]|nr:quinolinate synthase NadA [Bdellovibrionales bacterium]
MQIKQEITELKNKHNALILAHFYEDGEIQDIADYCGDSLFLAQKGQESSHPVVLMAGVVFMGEGIKLLSPEKTVLVPDMNAGCSLVNHSPYDDYKAWRDSFIDPVVVTYINSSTEVKSVSDVICTSSNAEKIIASIPENRTVLFGPDRNLGAYLSKKLNRKMELWPGACEVHVLFSAKKIVELKVEHPDALVLAHPECLESVLQFADIIGSTSHLINTVKESSASKFIIATEPGVIHQMRKHRPDALLLEAPAEGSCACNECPYMKLNTLEKIRDALMNLSPQIHLNADHAEKARNALEKMMTISRGQDVSWNLV